MARDRDEKLSNYCKYCHVPLSFHFVVSLHTMSFHGFVMKLSKNHQLNFNLNSQISNVLFTFPKIFYPGNVDRGMPIRASNRIRACGSLNSLSHSKSAIGFKSYTDCLSHKNFTCHSIIFDFNSTNPSSDTFVEFNLTYVRVQSVVSKPICEANRTIACPFSNSFVFHLYSFLSKVE
jgi:hypothetical protein